MLQLRQPGFIGGSRLSPSEHAMSAAPKTRRYGLVVGATVVGLGAWAELARKDQRGMDIDVHEFAVLGDGRRLALHRDRGFSTSATRMTAEQARRDVLTTVLPDDAEVTGEGAPMALAGFADQGPRSTRRGRLSRRRAVRCRVWTATVGAGQLGDSGPSYHRFIGRSPNGICDRRKRSISRTRLLSADSHSRTRAWLG